MTGQIRTRAPSGFTGCRGWVTDFRIGPDPASLQDVVATVMAHGLEHHFVLLQGYHASVLAEFGSWTNLASLGRVPMRDHLDATDFSETQVLQAYRRNAEKFRRAVRRILPGSDVDPCRLSNADRRSARVTE